MRFGLLVAACLAMLTVEVSAEPEKMELRHTARANGSAIEWRLLGRTAGSQGVLIVAQGSGCDPGARNENLLLAHRIAPTFAMVIVEKYGVAADAWSPGQSCSNEFVANDTLSGRVDDYQRVLAALHGEGWWNGVLVLMGESEGGAAMAMLAARERETDAVVLLSTGGGPSVGQDLLRIDVPILLIHGASDASTPVDSARATREAFAKIGRTNLTYVEKPGLDHKMIDEQGRSHIGEVFAEAATWVDTTLLWHILTTTP